MSMKILDYTGLQTLSNFVKQIKGSADANASAVSDLRDDLQGLASKLADVLNEVGGCIETLDSEKAYIAVRKSFSLAVSGWVENDNEEDFDYAYKYVLSVQGVSADTRVDAVLDSNSSSIAGQCEMCPTTESGSGTVVFKTRTIPEEALTGQLYITQGGAGSEET